jgi:hypothetical protein
MNAFQAKILLSALICACSCIYAQYYSSTPVPSYILEQFGPFGPQEKTYNVPTGAIFVAPNGLSTASGSSIDNPTTLPAAISKVTTGSVIVLRGGNYHVGNMSFNKKITIQPYLNEKPVIKGCSVAGTWTQSGANWYTTWDNLIHVPEPGFYTSSFGLRCFWWGDMVFINGTHRVPVESINNLASGKFYIDYTAKRVYIAENPAGKTIEITDLKDCFVRTHGAGADADGPTILGLVIMQFAEYAIEIQGVSPNVIIPVGQIPNAPVNTHIENCRLLYTGLEALMATGANFYIGYNDISMTTYCGLKINTAHNSIMEHNILHGNNTYGNRGYPAAAKIFMQSYNFTVRNNLVENNDADAIWYDVGHHEGKVYENYFRNNSSGGKLEISHRIYVANNVFENNGQAYFIMTQADVQLYNNTFINSRLEFGRDNRETDFHATTGPGPRNYHGHRVANNVFTGTPGGGYIWFTDDNTLDTNFQTDLFSQNLFLREASYWGEAAFNYKGWARTRYNTLADFRTRYGAYESGCVDLTVSSSSLFRNRSIGDYRLNTISGLPQGVNVPDSIVKILGWDPINCIGAFAQSRKTSVFIQNRPFKSGITKRDDNISSIKVYNLKGGLIKEVAPKSGKVSSLAICGKNTSRGLYFAKVNYRDGRSDSQVIPLIRSEK